MISWRLWQALKHPPEAHPVYQRTLAAYRKKLRTIPRQPIKKQKSGFQLNSAARRILIILALIVAGWFLSTGSAWLILTQPAISLIFVAIAIANVYAPRIAMKVSHQIGRERESSTYDLLNLTPSGALGTSWAICTGYLYHNQRFKDIWSAFEPICGGSVAVAGAAIIFILIGQITAMPSLPIDNLLYGSPMSAQDQVMLFLAAIGVVTVIYIDIVHSIVMGVILGCLMPNYVEGGFNTSIATLGSFLGLQVSIYVATLLVGTVIAPMVLNLLNMPDWFVGLGAGFLAIAFFYAVRASINRLLWRVTARQLNVEASEFGMLR